MLSRVADSLFWSSRFIERAENIARIVDVNQQLMLDIPSSQSPELNKNWLPLVECLGDEEAFNDRYKTADDKTVIHFLVFDQDNPNSLAGCLFAARENARTIREILPTEMWEQINRTYLWFKGRSASQFFERNQYDFFQRVKKSLQLFQGITDTTMIHGEGWEFVQMGKFLERADKTTRILDDQYHLFHKDKRATPSDLHLQWLAVLRSCSARRTYQRLYASGVQPIRVADFLILNETLPRSVIFSVLNLDQALRRISGVSPGHFSNEAEKFSGRLLAELTFSSIEDLWEKGLHLAMDEIQIKLNKIGQGIGKTYIHQSLEEISSPRIVPQPTQQQQEQQ